ncbi:hypothetical protein FA15DRAFT_675070 [Coprinopsis marcescibilis]|uniref:Uncharacterized protein n=1 Tax=Coprinopsis marcescibilis TaxID=230819 RepID=A0A5C3KFK6_COPMA|nr:hypothetical protein FA15DRAFT_675070 [Coprinopsis marcescibilis]
MQDLSPWNALPAATQQVLAYTLRSPSLIVLEFEERPLNVLNLCRPWVLKVKTVLFEDATVTDGPFNGLPTQPERESPIRLKSIRIALSSSETSFIGFVLDPRNRIDISGAEILDYATTGKGDGHPVLRSLLKSCAASLRILAFEAPQGTLHSVIFKEAGQ